jgi:hypothetical protein
LGEAKDDTAIEEFLVKKLQTENCSQKGQLKKRVERSSVALYVFDIQLSLYVMNGW